MKKIKIYLLLIVIIFAVGYYYFKKNQNKNLKQKIEFIIQQASIHSSESEKVKHYTLKYDKAALGLSYLKILLYNYNKSKIKSLSKINLEKFEKKINQNYLNAKKLLVKQCNLTNSDSSYLEDLSLKV